MGLLVAVVNESFNFVVEYSINDDNGCLNPFHLNENFHKAKYISRDGSLYTLEGCCRFKFQRVILFFYGDRFCLSKQTVQTLVKCHSSSGSSLFADLQRVN